MAASAEVERQGTDEISDEEEEHDGGVESESQGDREDPQPVSLCPLLEHVDREENQEAAPHVDEGSTPHLGPSLDDQEIKPVTPDTSI